MIKNVFTDKLLQPLNGATVAKIYIHAGQRRAAVL